VQLIQLYGSQADNWRVYLKMHFTALKPVALHGQTFQEVVRGCLLSLIRRLYSLFIFGKMLRMFGEFCLNI